MKREEESVQNALASLKGREMVYNFFKNEMFWMLSKSKRIKWIRSIIFTRILWNKIEIRIFSWNFIVRYTNRKINSKKKNQSIITKQMQQGLSITFTQVKAGNASENLANEIRQIVYSLCRAKQLLKQVYNILITSW